MTSRSMVESLEEKGLPVKGYTTDAFSKRDEERGIPGFASEIERGEWTIWDKDGSNKVLIEELKAHPYGDKDDCVLAGFFLREAIRKQKARGPQIPTVDSRRFSRVIQPRRGPSPLVRPTL